MTSRLRHYGRARSNVQAGSSDGFPVSMSFSSLVDGEGRYILHTLQTMAFDVLEPTGTSTRLGLE